MLSGIGSSDRWRVFNATNDMWPSIDSTTKIHIII